MSEMDGERIVLTDTPLPPSNPRGITQEFIDWSRAQTAWLLPAKYRESGSMWKVALAAGVAALGIIIVMKRRKR